MSESKKERPLALCRRCGYRLFLLKSSEISGKGLEMHNELKLKFFENIEKAAFWNGERPAQP